MRLYSYKVVYDIGFAPNPFHGTCSLATCKPKIRRGATPGDWIVGVGSCAKRTQGRLVYAMQVEEKLTFDEYWNDPRFVRKRPNRVGSLKYRYGDNVYHHSAEGQWVQEDCRHSLDDGTPNAAHVKRDTGADGVLLASRFTYWGGQGPELPPDLRDWGGVDLGEPGRDCTYKAYSPDMIEAFVEWIDGLAQGYQAPPDRLVSGDLDAPGDPKIGCTSGSGSTVSPWGCWSGPVRDCEWRGSVCPHPSTVRRDTGVYGLARPVYGSPA